MTAIIHRIERKAKRIASGKDQIKPGEAIRFPAAANLGDCVRQGDLYLTLVNSVPADFARPEKPSVQLVPGNTEGAKHCLDSLAAVDLFVPPKWDAESLVGPCFVTREEVTVLHPKHGSVTIPAGMTIRCDYQREYDAERSRERRNAD